MATNSILLSAPLDADGTIMLENTQDAWDEIYLEVSEGDATAGNLAVTISSGAAYFAPEENTYTVGTSTAMLLSGARVVGVKVTADSALDEPVTVRVEFRRR